MYIFNQSVVVYPGGSDRILLIGNNPRRVVFIVSGLTGANLSLATIPGTGAANVFYVGGALPSSVLTFANFGTLIQGPIWMQRLSGGTTDFSVTELVRINC